ncbi:hypothetical protein N9A76_03575 [Mariniblastus sp.]|nr:hypothetical protein [Mariniblastus sp.]MDB4545144.1 hypothetical protein [bacterium]
MLLNPVEQGDGDRHQCHDHGHNIPDYGNESDVNHSEHYQLCANEDQKDQRGETKVRSSLGKPSKTRSTNL